MTKISDLRPMSIGEVLDRSFQVLRRHVAPLFLTALLGILPMLGIYLSTPVYGGATTPEVTAGMAGVYGVFYILMFLTTAVSWGALTRDVDRSVQGEPVSLRDGLGHGFRAFLRVVGYAIMVYLAGIAVLLPAVFAGGIVMAVAGAILGESVAAIGVMVLVGGAALLGAALLWAPVAFLGLPAVILEGLGPVKAVRRANELGKGGRLRVTATALVAWIIMVLPTVGLSFLLGLGLSIWDPMAVGTASATQMYLYQVISFLVTGLTTPFMVAAMVFTYYDRRVRREGYDVELASESIQQMA